MDSVYIILAIFIGYVSGVITAAYAMAKGFSKGVDEAIKEHKAELWPLSTTSSPPEPLQS